MMRRSRGIHETLILLCLALVAPTANAQRCGAGASSESAGNQNATEIARKNVDKLFDGIALTASERETAVRVVAEAWNALVKLDWQSADYRQKFAATLLQRNERLLSLAKSRSDSAKVVGCFEEMRQSVPTRTTNPEYWSQLLIGVYANSSRRVGCAKAT